MASFKAARGIAAGKAASEKKSGSANFAPVLTWKAGDSKYIQILSSNDDIATLDYYPFLKVGFNKKSGKPMYRSFVARSDHDPIRERFGLTPKSRTFAQAVELSPITERVGKKAEITGWRVEERSYKNSKGEEITGPNVGLVIQPPGIFWGWAWSFAEDNVLSEYVFKITRQGGDINTQYHWFQVGEATELGDDVHEAAIDLDEYFEELASKERLKEYIDPLPDDWELDAFASKKAPKKAARAEADEEVEEGERKETRFDKLRREYTGS